MRRVLRIIILTILLFQVFACYADINPHNGVAYVLLPKEIPGIHGVYRLNEYSDPYDPILTTGGRRMFDLNFGGAVVVNGLAVNQSSKIYLFVGPNVTGEYTAVDEVGWLPAGRFDEDSPAYIKLIGQPFSADQISQDANSGLGNLCFPWGTTNYDNDFWDYGPEVWPYTHNRYLKGPFTDASGNSYMYKFDPYGPASHKQTPLWNGPGADAAGIRHPTDPYKVVLPNKWGGISWYGFGSPRAPAEHVAKLMDGKDGRPLMDQYDFRLSYTNRGNYSPYGDAKYISAVVKRVYEKRDRSLDLYAYMDTVVPPAAPPYSRYPTLEASNVLTATDLKITEMYGKTCADGCIPGGEMNPEAVGKIESCVQVFTSTTGRRYGFNPYGNKTGPYGANDAALRVVHSGTTYNLDVTDSNIKNFRYFTDFLGMQIESATILGVSSNFNPVATPITTAPDHLYASIADKFAIQDSWWGNGGIAYEYYSKDTETSGMTFQAGHIYRLNYLETDNPVPEDVGLFTGDIDAIGVDGHGNLYILYTELDCENLPAWPDENGLPQGPDLDKVDPTVPGNTIVSHPDFYEVSSWFRPGVGVPDYEIDSPSEAGDYIKVKFKQRVKKVCRKYTPSAGGGFDLSTVEDRGFVEAGFDAIRRDLVYNGPGDFEWLDLWRHEYGIGSRTASIDAEFAVVNIAERPSNIEPPGMTYSFCRYDRVPPDVPIEEDTEVTFKIEGYRPYGADGNIQHLVHIGSVPDIGDVYVNMIPPYINRDEDNDGLHKGSFPSGMFENNSTYNLDVKWHVDLIDPHAGEDYTESQVIKKWRNISPEPGLQKLLKFKFPQPGTYAVYATFSYNYFKYEDLAEGDRPDKLKDHIGTKVVTASDPLLKKVIYHVQSPSNTVTDGYISNITLDTGAIFEPAAEVNAAGQDGYGMIEDRAPASLSFTFDAQFVRDANNATGGTFSTYNGIGVWDYGVSPHVYNWNSDGTVNMTEYNPGRQKFANETSGPGPYKFNCGTRVDEAPKPEDLDAIKYRLIVYPSFIDDSGAEQTFPPVELGTGTCKFATITDLGNQKYQVKVDVPKANLKKIHTPGDPYKYKVRLELEYPRVKWHEHSHVSASGIVSEAQYRSIIPDTPPKGMISNEPTTPTPADTGRDTTTGLFNGNDYWEICARDITIIHPEFEGISMDDSNPVAQIATHTTGDPVPPCQIRLSISDNNPNSRLEDIKLRYELPTNKRNPNPPNRSDNHFVDPSDVTAYAPKPSGPSFIFDDEYKIGATYTFSVPEYGGTAGTSNLFDPGKTYQHWIGTLSFSLEGKLFDGLGATDTNDINVPHQFKKDATDPRLKTYACGLIRYDNDPPSIRVNIVSQADNRRWQIDLIEANRDLVANPTLQEQIASPSLTVKCFKLVSSETEDSLLKEGTVEVTGSCNVPVKLDKGIVTDIADITNADVIEALPNVRRSSRIMVTVGIADNVDYVRLASASIEITEAGASPLLPVTGLKTEYFSDDDLEASLDFNRGRFYVDMPMRVMDGQSLPGNPQVKITVFAEDSSGNCKTLVIPIRVVDSTFDARVLESNENRGN
ncbi:MAG: hypothetical protein Kow0029_13770 [Candidatus Rifleibacteriota bacterium]